MIYVWLCGRHPLMIAFLVALYVLIALHFWYVTVPALAVLIVFSVLRSHERKRRAQAVEG